MPFLNRFESDLLLSKEEALAFYAIYLARESVQNAASYIHAHSKPTFHMQIVGSVLSFSLVFIP